ncbi:uncharacterized protein LTR77_000294 [Saxophila tyrrhenica]|uniref:MRG-binding protein n=1 Tax=Saxophila tyrrhenica TaxID=1690608 RepID=A0AAV9PMU3_9PEZI|nr:hypothetical protein LTR77_000294 [Saxophila tyrrhenica]
MPPRKKAKVSHAASPTPTSQPKTPTPAESSPNKAAEQLINDPWTDEEEIGLFKGLMRWKPTGIHKHFHLLSLHQFLLDGGYIHPKSEHTKPAGIWRKLETLYNLEALDEREDARQLDKVEIPAAFRIKRTDSDEEMSSSADNDADAYSDAANKIDNDDFELPDAEFGQEKWERRLEGGKQRKGSSPMVLPELNKASEPPVRFTPSFSIEPSEAATPASRTGRPRAGTAGAKGRAAAAAASAASGTRRSTRHAESVAGDEEQDDEQEDEPDEDEDEEESGQSKQSTPAPRSTRSTKGARGRPARGQKRRGRGK